MKKQFLLLAITTILFSCNKNDNDNTNGSLSDNQFRIGTTTFAANSVTNVNGIFASLGTNGTTTGSISVVFNTPSLPHQSGTYKIVENPDADDEIYVTAGTNTDGNIIAYASTGNNNNSAAAVTVSNEKVTLIFSDVWVKKATDNDSIKISANLTHQ